MARRYVRAWPAEIHVATGKRKGVYRGLTVDSVVRTVFGRQAYYVPAPDAQGPFDGEFVEDIKTTRGRPIKLVLGTGWVEGPRGKEAGSGRAGAVAS